MAVTIALNSQIYQVYWYMYIIVCNYAHVYKGLDKTSAAFAEPQELKPQSTKK